MRRKRKLKLKDRNQRSKKLKQRVRMFVVKINSKKLSLIFKIQKTTIQKEVSNTQKTQKKTIMSKKNRIPRRKSKKRVRWEQQVKCHKIQRNPTKSLPWKRNGWSFPSGERKRNRLQLLVLQDKNWMQSLHLLRSLLCKCSFSFLPFICEMVVAIDELLHFKCMKGKINHQCTVFN